MIDRRGFLAGAAALGALAGCGGPEASGPGVVTIVATASPGMNAATDGSDRPLTLHVVQLRAAGAFDTADFFALQDPATALGGDLVKADQLVVAPGGTVTRAIALDGATTMIGVIAGFRDPGGRMFRASTSIAATDTVTFSVEIGAAGIRLVAA